MSDALHRLVYVSDNQIEGDEDAIAKEVGHILAQARESNEWAGLTGALLFNTDRFAQVLEGGRSRVEEVFERIQCDMRHANISILAFDAVDERHFAGWSMGYIGRQTEAAEQFKYIGELSGFDSEKLDGDAIFELLKSHMHEAERV